LIVRFELRHIAFENLLDAVAEPKHFDFGEMREDFAHRPALHRWLPVHLFVRRGAKNFFDYDRCLFKDGNSGQLIFILFGRHGYLARIVFVIPYPPDFVESMAAVKLRDAATHFQMT